MLNVCKIVGLFAIAVSTSACVSNTSSQNFVSETPRQNYVAPAKIEVTQTQMNFFQEPLATQKVASVSPVKSLASPYEVVDVQVVVPDYLVVSEANVYQPKADIVWREDPLGDRYEQVKTIIEGALRKGTAPLHGQRQVIMAVRVNTFLSITEKTRNSVGGKHNVHFEYVLLDAKTRQPVTPVQNIDASLKAFGGAKAYRAMRAGQTQKVRITNHVAGVVQAALSSGSQV